VPYHVQDQGSPFGIYGEQSGNGLLSSPNPASNYSTTLYSSATIPEACDSPDQPANNHSLVSWGFTYDTALGWTLRLSCSCA